MIGNGVWKIRLPELPVMTTSCLGKSMLQPTVRYALYECGVPPLHVLFGVCLATPPRAFALEQASCPLTLHALLSSSTASSLSSRLGPHGKAPKQQIQPAYLTCFSKAASTTAHHEHHTAPHRTAYCPYLHPPSAAYGLLNSARWST